MIDELFPEGALSPDERGCSVQSLIFGHRIKPQQTRYEYLAEFLQVAMARKKLEGSSGQPSDEMFIISDDVNRCMIEYYPISNMGLKRFIFFDNSRLDTKSKIDDEAYKRCLSILTDEIDSSAAEIEDTDAIYILQNILYGFSIENAGRSWFNKNLLPVCPEVLFPESLARKRNRKDVSLESIDTDHSFDFTSYTYMARGGEIYYLHILHAVNNEAANLRDTLEDQLRRLLCSIPQLQKISSFIEERWQNGMNFEDKDKEPYPVKKTTKAIPLDYKFRDRSTVSELTTFLNNRMQPMEKLDLLSYGIVLQIFRLMIGVAAAGSQTAGSAWVLDVCEKNKKEHAEVKKLAAHCYQMNEESITKYIDRGLERFFADKPEDEKNDLRKKADNDSNAVIRKLGKSMGLIIPRTGADMRFTLSEEIIEFLVLALVPAGAKVTFDQFLDMLYEHFEIVIAPEHYTRAAADEKVMPQANVTFLQMNKTDFAQKLKNCGFLRDLSDATSIVENPYESEADRN